MTTIQTPSPLLTPVEVAQLLRVNIQTLSVWRKAGTGPKSVKVSERKLRYRQSDVEAWLDARSGGQNA